MGNPHAVIIVDDVEQAPVSLLGPQVQQHALFPEGVNVGFMQIKDNSHILLRVFERGTGETLACGSGACAAVVAGCRDGLLHGTIDVKLSGGNLAITWQGEGKPVWMVGSATTVYEGHIDL
jgi:diaminopimelate epimerase